MATDRSFIELSAERPSLAMDEYSIGTPYGTVTISQGGRSIAFDLYSDVRQSRHHVALFAYVQKIRREGVIKFNTDHIAVAGRDRRLSLNRGKAKLDLVYQKKGKTYECELKTNREIGLDVTARQLTELCAHVDMLTLLVPRGALEEADYIATLINLRHKITIEPYDGWAEEENEG